MDDLISRQAAIDCEYQVKIINDIEYVMLSEVQMKMRKLPSAQPTIEPRKKGKWIFCENETGEGSNTYKCSACGEIQMIISGTPKENGWAYCPHCGAKMGEEDIRDENMG